MLVAPAQEVKTHAPIHTHVAALCARLLSLCATRYVARKALKPPGFPITRWEFYGSTSLLEATAYLDVSVPGVYELAASSEDRFMLWLQDWWLHMQEAEWGYATWTVRANFTAPGGRCVLAPGTERTQCLHDYPSASSQTQYACSRG